MVQEAFRECSAAHEWAQLQDYLTRKSCVPKDHHLQEPILMELILPVANIGQCSIPNAKASPILTLILAMTRDESSPLK